MNTPENIRLRRRIGLWFAAWSIAGFACAFPDPRVLFYAHLFPFGLLFLLLPRSAFGNDTTFSFIVLAWLFYAALTIVALAQKTSLKYFRLFILLCFLLLLNVAGCQVMMHAQVRN